MSGICGWFRGNSAGSVNPQTIETMAVALGRRDGVPVHGASADFGAVAAMGRDADIFHDDRRIVSVWGRARFGDPDLTAIAQREGVARALAQGYARKGTDILKALSGTFAIAILDRETGEAVLAIDRVGIQPLCYEVVGGTLVFASTLDAISLFPGSTARIDPQAIYDYVYFHMVPGPRTIYSGRNRLPAGSYLVWRNGTLATRRYWEIRYDENVQRPIPELKKEFLDTLRAGVSEAAQEGSVGAFLSGGTDSSTVVGMLGK